jgi:hypothetical protein
MSDPTASQYGRPAILLMSEVVVGQLSCERVELATMGIERGLAFSRPGVISYSSGLEIGSSIDLGCSGGVLFVASS